MEARIAWAARDGNSAAAYRKSLKRGEALEETPCFRPYAMPFTRGRPPAKEKERARGPVTRAPGPNEAPLYGESRGFVGPARLRSATLRCAFCSHGASNLQFSNSIQRMVSVGSDIRVEVAGYGGRSLEWVDRRLRFVALVLRLCSTPSLSI